MIGDEAGTTATSNSKNTFTSTVNKTENSSPVASSVSKSENDKKRNERLLIVYAPLVGSRVTVFLYDGAVFEGTLESFETGGNEFALILRMATMIRSGQEVIDPSIKAGVTFELMNIRFEDMAELKAVGSGTGNSASGASGGIGTDSAISKRRGDFGKERELHRWTPENGTADMNNSLDAANSSSTKWDQFATNEKLFGLKTDFNEEMYTTKLDRNSAHIRANEAKAERIAKEIMAGSTGGNIHLADERGFEGACEDEEMLYGAVIREDQTSGGGNLPPGFRNIVPSEETDEKPKSKLNPEAAEFKLNVNAPEFKPSNPRVTYYNQPRRNLTNYQNFAAPIAYYPVVPVNATGAGYPSVPYYYVPPPVITSQPTTSETPTTTTTTGMNPNAADFVMPQGDGYYYPHHQPPYYYQPQGYNYYHNQ